MNPDEYTAGNTKIRLVKGDIIEMTTNAIVNAANSSLMGGGGVDGAIHRKGGPRVLEECRRIRQTTYPEGLPTGEAVITSGGNLKAKHIIHTVGPVWHGGNHDEPKLLADAYRNSLRLAVENGLKSVAFPSISTGAYGYPIEEASRIALRTTKEFVDPSVDLIEVVFVLFSDFDLAVYRQAALEVFGVVSLASS